MDYLKEKVAYLKGLAEGMQINESTNEGKLLKEIINVMDSFAVVADDLQDASMDLEDRMDEIDEDLGALESTVYDEYPASITCSHCGEEFEVEPEMLFDDFLLCPVCNEKIEVEIDCDCDEDCECDCE